MGDWLEEARQRARAAEHDVESGVLQAGGILAVCFVVGLFGMWPGGMGLIRAERAMLSFGSLFLLFVSACILWKRAARAQPR